MNRPAPHKPAPTARDTLRRWLVPALLLSLAVHVFLWAWSKNIPVQSMSDSFYEKIVPRTFHLERVEIDPRLLAEEPDEKDQERLAPKPVKLPEEKIAFESAANPDPDLKTPPRLDTALLEEKPEIPASNAPASALQPVDDPLADELLAEMPALDAPAPATGTAGANPAPATNPLPGDSRGFSDLDALLARTGPLTPDTAPILMPADLLFEYDAHNLQPAALESLRKLGTLLKRNPGARFLIEGHSDSFGTGEYNLRLSLLRAESVKNWLSTEFGIPAASISTKGFGETRLIAPAEGDIGAQRLNRRVEIVILEQTQ
jgi:outer membrane protein OmpA-like peptidoglycan-associated protein